MDSIAQYVLVLSNLTWHAGSWGGPGCPSFCSQRVRILGSYAPAMSRRGLWPWDRVIGNSLLVIENVRGIVVSLQQISRISAVCIWVVVRGAFVCSLVGMGLIIESILVYWYGSIVDSVGCIIIIICKILSQYRLCILVWVQHRLYIGSIVVYWDWQYLYYR